MTGMCDECATRPAVVRVHRLDSLGAAHGSAGAFCCRCLVAVARWLEDVTPRTNAEFPAVDVEDCCLN